MLKNWVKKTAVCLIAGCVLMLSVIPATATRIDYTDVVGSTVSFLDIYEDTISITDGEATTVGALYGAPIYAGGNQLFFPANFISTSADGHDNTTTGDLSMTLRAADGLAIQQVVIYEYGNYTLTGGIDGGTNLTSASIIPTYNVYGQSGTIGMIPKSTFSLPADSAGAFSGSVVLDFSGLGIREMTFLLTNELTTTSEAGTVATIQKSIVSNQTGVEIFTAPVPVPAALWLLGSGLVALLGIRRRVVMKP